MSMMTTLMMMMTTITLMGYSYYVQKSNPCDGKWQAVLSRRDLKAVYNIDMSLSAKIAIANSKSLLYVLVLLANDKLFVCLFGIGFDCVCMSVCLLGCSFVCCKMYRTCV